MASEAEYDAHRIGLGVPEGGIDFAFGDAFPHDADMDQLGGVDFDKGCYVGQEVVSRMEHRGTARRRIVLAEGVGLTARTEITAAGKPIGQLTSTAAERGLALVRLDRAKEAMDQGQPILAGAASLTLALPPWARFTWPHAEAASA
jgi:folate-binding protein YgfZ